MRTLGGRNRLICGLVALALAAAMPAAGADDGFVRAPVLLYISGSSSARLPEPVGQVRQFATERLDAALVASGADAIPAARLVPLLTAHRVRGAMGLPPAFLADLRQDSGANHLLVTVLLAGHDRLQLLSRLVRLDDHCVVWAGIDEEPLPTATRHSGAADASTWYDALARLIARCRPAAAAPDAAAAPRFMLPAHGIGCEPELALAATHAVLAVACADERLRITDPGVAAAILATAGTPAARLDAPGRTELVRVMGHAPLLLPELTVYASTGGAMGAADGDELPPADAAVEEYAIALRIVDDTTGVVLGTAVRHRPHGVRVGWFGLTDRTSVLEGLGRAAREIWNELDHNLEERQ